MSRSMGCVGETHTMPYYAHYNTSGMGHIYQQRYKSVPIQDDEHFLLACPYVERNALRAGLVKRTEAWRWASLWRWRQSREPDPKLLSPWPIPRLPNWAGRVNEPLGDAEMESVRRCVQRSRPLESEKWVESMAGRLGLESTLRPSGRQRVRPKLDEKVKEA